MCAEPISKGRLLIFVFCRCFSKPPNMKARTSCQPENHGLEPAAVAYVGFTEPFPAEPIVATTRHRAAQKKAVFLQCLTSFEYWEPYSSQFLYCLIVQADTHANWRIVIADGSASGVRHYVGCSWACLQFGARECCDREDGVVAFFDLTWFWSTVVSEHYLAGFFRKSSGADASFLPRLFPYIFFMTTPVFSD